jgi:quercetin dioxygenase-like cupin family protein/DNA-binding CsgD family transcriptional regulator
MTPTRQEPLLTPPQMRVLGLLAGRLTNAEIAHELGLSSATVKWRVSQLLSELGFERREDAGDWWQARHGVRPTAWRDLPKANTRRRTVDGAILGKAGEAFAAKGGSLAIEEWQGSAPGELHVHRSDDIAWHVLEGSLHFRLAERGVDVRAGETIFFPAGTPHTYGEGDEARYLVIAPPRLFELFLALRTARTGRPHTDWGRDPDPAIYARFDSELLEPK